MILESLFLNRLFNQSQSSQPQLGGGDNDGAGNGGSGIGGLFAGGMIIVWIFLGIVYLIGFMRTVWVAFKCQGMLQGLLALLVYPLYLLLAIPSLVQASLCQTAATTASYY